MKRPAFQFYPADWQKDAALQSCSIGARGLWIEMMCIMHQCEPYGSLAVNGSPMTTTQLARLVGDTPAAIKRLLGELEAAGVFSRNASGDIFSRRMVKDERIRNVRAEAGKLGGNPGLVGDKDKQKVKQTDNHTDKQSPTPSSSASSSWVLKEPVEKETSVAVQIAVALRSLGVKNASSMHPDVIAWADAGVTVEQAKEAARIAIEDRKIAHPSVGYLVGILNDLRNPKAAQPVAAMNGKPWFIQSHSAIVAKGAEKGIAEDVFDSTPDFRAAVFEAHGVTAEQVRKAELDYGSKAA